MIKAVICDIDNTLTDTTSWLEITERLGLPSQRLSDIFGEFLRGKLAHEDATRQVIELWRSSGKANKPYFETMFSNWQLRNDAETFMDYVQTKGWQSVLITGSVDLFAEAIAKKLGADHWYANTTLIWDDQGELVDMVYVKDQATLKLQQLQGYVAEQGISLDECLVVADGDNDVETFRATRKGIAVGSAHPALLKVAWKQADTLSDVVDLLREV